MREAPPKIMQAHQFLRSLYYGPGTGALLSGVTELFHALILLLPGRVAPVPPGFQKTGRASRAARSRVPRSLTTPIRQTWSWFFTSR